MRWLSAVCSAVETRPYPNTAIPPPVDVLENGANINQHVDKCKVYFYNTVKAAVLAMLENGRLFPVFVSV
jgi:hypothetical protein